MTSGVEAAAGAPFRVQPARITFDDDGTPRSLDYGDVYHARAGAWEQGRHVFLAGNGLPARWRARARFVIVETGFGLGHNFLATWAAWRDDPQRCERLFYLAVERHPPLRTDLQRAHAASPEPALARELLAHWPAATPDLHLLRLAAERITLCLAFGDAQQLLPRLLARADAFFLDGFAPDRNPAMWSPQLLARLRHLAADGATAATWSVARPVRDGLAAAGFEVERCSGFDRKREMLAAKFAPRYALKVPAGRRFGIGPGGTVAVIGAGLAGAAAARALHRHGLDVMVFDAADEIAQGASGQPGGVLHGVVHAADGIHARWHRAAFAHATRLLGASIADGSAQGRLLGLLRVEPRSSAATLRERLMSLGLPAEHVQALDPHEAAARAGLPLPHAAWWFPAGGWVDPRSAVRAWLAGAGERRLGVRIDRLEQTDAGAWRLFDAAGHLQAQVDQVVLACARDAARLAAGITLPWRASRGQITLLPSTSSPLPRPLVPLAGNGYALTLPDGTLLCGATHDADDDESALRDDDHRRNLDALARLTGCTIEADVATLGGRVAWRMSMPDRLPVIGALPSTVATALRPDQPRFVERRAGLHVLAGLGSRGLAQSALGGEIVASWISAAPMPVSADLLDAVDVARWPARAVRQAARNTAAGR